MTTTTKNDAWYSDIKDQLIAKLLKTFAFSDITAEYIPQCVRANQIHRTMHTRYFKLELPQECAAFFQKVIDDDLLMAEVANSACWPSGSIMSSDKFIIIDADMKVEYDPSYKAHLLYIFVTIAK